ncbi:hypothetical protein [Frankia sp. AgB32]|uniref:hypothetical protein n=1 Tax=Frankia sp. AgB32 TaxID=631119 RepID=UPI00200EDA38|nr:hypothetical protein [Frankia sp. AgB32]MCK9895821.1 hypothetical protein [Frankia sp. AgB32]
MPVIADDVEIVLVYQQPLRRLVPVMSTPRQLLDREHTRIFLEEIQLRYPAGPAAALVAASIAAINAAYAVHPRITPALVRAEISNQEHAAGLADTAPPPPAALGPVGAPARRAILLARMQSRRGAYTWKEGRSADFTAWIGGAAPLANPISIDATINCWEAVLVAAAEGGLVTIAQLTQAYGAADPNAAVYNLLTHGGTVTVNCAAAALANNIHAGDVIMMEHVGQNLHHVMVVLTASPADYRQIEVLSLWGTHGGFIVTRATLSLLIIPTTVFRYSTL